MLRVRELAVRASYRGNAELATPAEFQMWAKDLRRGRANFFGGLIRFFELVDRREMGDEARAIKAEAIALAAEFADLNAPRSDIHQQPANTRAVDISSETRAARGVVQYGKLQGRVGRSA